MYEMECKLLNERQEPVTEFKCCESVKQWEGRAWHKVSSLINVVLLFSLECFFFSQYYHTIILQNCNILVPDAGVTGTVLQVRVCPCCIVIISDQLRIEINMPYSLPNIITVINLRMPLVGQAGCMER
jgi:hypothetical protein